MYVMLQSQRSLLCVAMNLVSDSWSRETTPARSPRQAFHNFAQLQIHAIRSFGEAVGVPPHRQEKTEFVQQRRVKQVRDRLTSRIALSVKSSDSASRGWFCPQHLAAEVGQVSQAGQELPDAIMEFPRNLAPFQSCSSRIRALSICRIPRSFFDRPVLAR